MTGAQIFQFMVKWWEGIFDTFSRITISLNRPASDVLDDLMAHVPDGAEHLFTAFEYLLRLVGDASMWEVFFGAGVFTFIGFRIIMWVIDILP